MSISRRLLPFAGGGFLHLVQYRITLYPRQGLFSILFLLQKSPQPKSQGQVFDERSLREVRSRQVVMAIDGDGEFISGIGIEIAVDSGDIMAIDLFMADADLASAGHAIWLTVHKRHMMAHEPRDIDPVSRFE